MVFEVVCSPSDFDDAGSEVATQGCQEYLLTGMLFVGVSSSFPLRVLCLALFVRFQHFPQYVPVRKLPMLSVSSIATRSKSVTTKLVVLDDVHLVQEIFVLDFCTLPRAVGTHASTMAAAPLRT